MTTKVAMRAVLAMSPTVAIGDVKVIDLRESLPQRPGVSYAYRTDGQITGIIWHHTAGNEAQPIHDIADYHVRVRKWPGIGYHFAIDSEGKVFQMQSVNTVSYHAYMNNTPNIGIVLVGNYEDARPTRAMRSSAKALLRVLRSRYGIKNVYLHKETKATLCPGKYAAMMLNGIR